MPLLTYTESPLHASPVSSAGSSLFNCSLCQHSALSSLLLCILSISPVLLSHVPVIYHHCMVKKYLVIFNHPVSDIYVYRIAGKFGGFKIWRICPKMHLVVFKFGRSAPYNYYCTINLIIICLTVCAKD